jgi:hypothetical protein
MSFDTFPRDRDVPIVVGGCLNSGRKLLSWCVFLSSFFSFFFFLPISIACAWRMCARTLIFQSTRDRFFVRRGLVRQVQGTTLHFFEVDMVTRRWLSDGYRFHSFPAEIVGSPAVYEGQNNTCFSATTKFGTPRSLCMFLSFFPVSCLFLVFCVSCRSPPVYGTSACTGWRSPAVWVARSVRHQRGAPHRAVFERGRASQRSATRMFGCHIHWFESDCSSVEPAVFGLGRGDAGA